MTFEVDYHAQADVDALRLFNSSGAVNQTYALYGMNITFIIDDEITGSDSAEIEDAYEADDLEDENHDRQGSTAYFFVTKEWGGDDPQGKASSAGSNRLEGYDYGGFIFTSEHGFPRQNHYAKTSVHEIGHLLGAGRLDDTPYRLKKTEGPNEVYSGATSDTRDVPDKTLERVRLEGMDTFNWSAMVGGYHDSLNDRPMDGEYIAFSIEELLELEFESIDSRGDRFIPP